MEGLLSTKLNPSTKHLVVNFLLRIFFLRCPTLGNTNNIIITVQLDKQLYYYPFFSTVASVLIVRVGVKMSDFF